MWHEICHWLVLLWLIGGLVAGVVIAAVVRKELPPTGMLGIFLVIVRYVLTAIVVWRSGALSTIVGSP